MPRYEESGSGEDATADKVDKKAHTTGIVRRTIMNIPRFSFKREKVSSSLTLPTKRPKHLPFSLIPTPTQGLD